MCYSGNLDLVSHRELALRRRWHASQANMAAANYVRAPAEEESSGGGSGSGGGKRYCMCSPTQHPGSFRCRQHHGEYAWGASGRAVNGAARVVVE